MRRQRSSSPVSRKSVSASISSTNTSVSEKSLADDAADAAVPPSVRRRREHEKLIVRLFKAVDSDGDGFLEKRELQRGLRNAACLKLINMAPALGGLLDPEHWEKTFHEMDGEENTDGRVTFTEFHRYCMDIIGFTDDGLSHIDNTDVPTNDQAISLLQVPSADRKEEHIDSLLIWSKSNEATKKLFSKLPKDLLREVVRELKYMTIEPGQFVCEQGDVGTMFYVILKGTIECYVRTEEEQVLEMKKRKTTATGKESPPSDVLIREKRIGRMVASLTTGAGFGELALLKPAGEGQIRSASCLCPGSKVGVPPPEKCHLLTLARNVYYRLYRATTQNIGTDIGAKVRTIQDSIAFRQWPRSHVVRFCIQLQIVKFPKNTNMIRSGDKADRFFLICSGEVSETQPMTFRESCNNTTTNITTTRSSTSRSSNKKKRTNILVGNSKPTIIYPWHTSTPRSTKDDKRYLNKINIDLGTYGPLDVVGGLPTMCDYPYYFTSLKAKTNVVAVSIGRTYFNMFLRPPPPTTISTNSNNKNNEFDIDNDSITEESIHCNNTNNNQKDYIKNQNLSTNGDQIENEEEETVSPFYNKTIQILTKACKLRETMRKQRVRTALSSPHISCKMTAAMTRNFTTCGRCGRCGHRWGEENDYGMLKCPMGQGAGRNSNKKRHSLNFFGDSKLSKKDIVRLKHEKRNQVNKTTRRTTPKLMGSERWSSRQSLRMRGGTKCTINSLASLLSMYEKEDVHDTLSSGYNRPATSIGHLNMNNNIIKRPNTSIGFMSKLGKISSKKLSTSAKQATVATAPAASKKSFRFSPNLRGRSLKVMELMNIYENNNFNEFAHEFRRTQHHYVTARDLSHEEEGRQFDKETRGHHLLSS
jgi:CRP-like cAMP-binding protein